MSQSSNHLRLVSWTWQWVHFIQIASTVTRSQSNRAHLGCGEREIRIMDVQTTNLQQLRDQHLVESMLLRIKAVLKAKVGPTRYKHSVPNKVASECMYVCVCIYIYIYISGGLLSALTCCVNARLLSAIKKISPLIYSQSWVGSWVYTTYYDDFHPDILARMYT